MNWMANFVVLAAAQAVPAALAATAQAAPSAPDEQPRLSPQQQQFLERLAELARGAPPREEATQGDGVITGKITTEEGEPLAGVEVRAITFPSRAQSPEPSPFAPATYWEPDWKQSLSEQLDREARSTFGAARTIWRVESGADGTFRLEQLPRTIFSLQASHPGYSVIPQSESSRNLLRVRPDVDVAFTALPLVRVLAVLRLADGTPPPLAKFFFSRQGTQGMPLRQSWRPESPELLLPVGDWQIEAAVEGPATAGDLERAVARSKKVDYQAVAGSSAAPLEMVLETVRAIHGEIGLPMARAFSSPRCTARPLAEGEEEAAALAATTTTRRDGSPSNEVRGHLTESAANFASYWIGPLTPGRWLVSVDDGRGRGVAARAVVEVRDDAVRRDFQLAAPTRAEVVRVRVLDPAGAPLRDCSFELSTELREADGRLAGGTNGAITLEQETLGWYTLPRAKLRLPEQVVQGSRANAQHLLAARHLRYGSVVQELAAGVEQIEFRFAAPVQLEVRLEQFAENVAGRKVELRLRSGDSVRALPRPLVFAGESLAAERIAIGTLQPGRWIAELLVHSPSERRKDGRLAAVAEWSLTSGATERSIAVPRLQTVVVTLSSDSKGARFASLKRVDPLSPYPRSTPVDERCIWSEECQATDRVEFVDVAPGRYWLACGEAGGMPVTVPTAGPILFEAQPVTVKRVVLTAPRGALAAAGVRDGDWLVALDGSEFGESSPFESIVEQLHRRQRGTPNTPLRATFTFEHARERFERVLPTEILWRPELAGGGFLDDTRDE